jgi:mannose-6-phosphate isomerase-like protein (cupin superfamily)
MVTSGTLPDFPGSVGLSALSVYPWPTADHEHGGSAHVHLASAECYIVISGRGRLQTLDHSGPGEHRLEPGDVVWFTPGTIHRAVNDGDLHVMVLMQNSGLPEAGDAVLTFPPEYLDPSRYPDAASTLDELGRPSEERARARRDLALRGYEELLDQFRRGNTAALGDFYRAAVRLTAPNLGRWTQIVEDGAAQSAARTMQQIEALRSGDHRHLLQAETARIAGPSTQSLGMCGFLRAYDPIRRSGGSDQ